MEELLAALADPQPDGLRGAWARCEEAGKALIELTEDPKNIAPEARGELRVGLDRLMRLNAIARELALKSQLDLSTAISDKREKQAQVDAYAEEGKRAGGTCDLAG